MVQKARIKLASTDLKKLEEVCSEIKDIAEKTGVKVSGPIFLPTKKLKVVTRKSPCGEGSETFDKWVMKIHKRLFYITADERFVRRLMRVRIPDDVYVEVRIS
jgi:small subunit ribosomal protein S10